MPIASMAISLVPWCRLSALSFGNYSVPKADTVAPSIVHIIKHSRHGVIFRSFVRIGDGTKERLSGILDGAHFWPRGTASTCLNNFVYVLDVCCINILPWCESFGAKQLPLSYLSTTWIALLLRGSCRVV